MPPLLDASFNPTATLIPTGGGGEGGWGRWQMQPVTQFSQSILCRCSHFLFAIDRHGTALQTINAAGEVTLQ